MVAALMLAARGLGHVWPNPAVGCILVREGRVVGRGWTQPGGRPHAETEALGRAGARARGASAYVTLEPCAHQGETPPCADALVNAGISRAVIALGDPDPRVAGRGVARLRAAGIEVVEGVGAGQAETLNEGYLKRVSMGRPLVTLKLATSADARVATASGASRWITGEAARARGHLLRARHDAVAIGIGTALADDPELTCRLPGLEHRTPVRVVFDSRLGLPPEGKLALGAADVATWVICREGAGTERREALVSRGVEIIEVDADGDGRVALDAALHALAARGLTRLLVEGGPNLAIALLKARLVDRLAWFRSPGVIGDDGLPALGVLGVSELSSLFSLRRLDVVPCGEDVLETYAVAS